MRGRKAFHSFVHFNISIDFIESLKIIVRKEGDNNELLISNQSSLI